MWPISQNSQLSDTQIHDYALYGLKKKAISLIIIHRSTIQMFDSKILDTLYHRIINHRRFKSRIKKEEKNPAYYCTTSIDKWSNLHCVMIWDSMICAHHKFAIFRFQDLLLGLTNTSFNFSWHELIFTLGSSGDICLTWQLRVHLWLPHFSFQSHDPLHEKGPCWWQGRVRVLWLPWQLIVTGILHGSQGKFFLISWGSIFSHGPEEKTKFFILLG